MLELNNLLALGGSLALTHGALAFGRGLAFGGSLASSALGGLAESDRRGDSGGRVGAMGTHGTAHLASTLAHRALALGRSLTLTAFLGGADLSHHGFGSGRTLGRATFATRRSATTSLGESGGRK